MEHPAPSARDQAWIVSTYRDDADFAEILQVFIEELPVTHARLQETVARRDFDALRREAHKLRGSAGGYGFQQISDRAGSLEKSCHDLAGNEEAILRMAQDLLDDLNRVRA